MGLGDLARQDQSDARAIRFSREEWHEQVRRAGQSRSFVADTEFKLPVALRPAKLDTAACFERGIYGVAYQVDQ